MITIDYELKRLGKYIPLICHVCDTYSVEAKLMIGIAILENMNRPGWIRYFERILPTTLVKFDSFGLMQVRSNHYVNDVESINMAVRIVSKINKKIKDIDAVGQQYNGSIEYGKCLKYIVSLLSGYNFDFKI